MTEQAIEATIHTQGEVWFASREVGRLADTESYLLNTALYYAFGFAAGRYVDAQFEPTYIDDTKTAAEEVYVSPAAPVGQVGDAVERTNYITSTYNTSDDNYATLNLSAQDDPDAKRNLPSYGRRRALGHDNFFRLYLIPREADAETLSDRLPQYVRLGKKRGKARIDSRIVPAEVQSGAFQLGHPISAYDSDQAPTGNLITKRMRPTPLLIQGDYSGEYIAIRVDDHEEEDTKSDGTGDSEYVCFPSDVTFLRTKR